MFATVVAGCWVLAGVYAVMGVLFAVPFVCRWAGQLDASARTGSWGFRLIILPGVVALWPVLAGKVWRVHKGAYVPPVAEKPVPPRWLRKIHGMGFRVLAVAMPVVCAAALVLRPPETPATPEAEGKVFAQVLAGPVVSSVSVKADGFSAVVELRMAGAAAQAVVTVQAPLKEPVVAAYWSATRAETELPKDAVFLGSVWGPAALPYDLPAAAATDHGSLYFLSLTDGQKLLAVAPLGGK
jgi:hypothetical protein